MPIKLFILGRPGSGKSTAYRYIQAYMEQWYPCWSISRYLDYNFLYAMYLREKRFPDNNRPQQFRSTKFGGFDVLDFSVLDTALKNLEKQAWQSYSPLEDELIVIEFARDDYKKALRQFRATFLKDAYFLFIEADLPTCIQRVKDRVVEPSTIDNHFVSEDILTTYYGERNILPDFKKDFRVAIDKKRVKIISSQGSLSAFNTKVEKFIQAILPQEDPLMLLEVAHKAPAPKVVTPLLVPRR